MLNFCISWVSFLSFHLLRSVFFTFSVTSEISLFEICVLLFPQQQSLWDSIIYNFVSVHWTCKYGANASQLALSHSEGLIVVNSWKIFSFLRYALKYTPGLISEQICLPRFLILCLIFMGLFFLALLVLLP